MFFMLTMCVVAEEDDDNVLTDLLLDIATGIAIEMCSKSAGCSALASMVMMAFIVIAFIAWACEGFPCNCRWPTNRELNREVRRGGGIFLGRRLASNW